MWEGVETERVEGNQIMFVLPDDVGVGEFLQQADLSYDAVLVHVIFVDLHHHHLPTGAVHHLKDMVSIRDKDSDTGACVAVVMGRLVVETVCSLTSIIPCFFRAQLRPNEKYGKMHFEYLHGSLIMVNKVNNVTLHTSHI